MQARKLTAGALCALLFYNSLSFAIFPEIIQETIQKATNLPNIPQEIIEENLQKVKDFPKTPTNQVPPNKVLEKKIDNQSSSDSCETMAMQSPKASVIGTTVKNIATGAILGALAGFLLDKENRARGAILGAIAGATAGTAYSVFVTKDLQKESYEDVVKRLGYKGDGSLIRLEVKNTDKDKQYYKQGEYANFVVKVIYLTPKKDDEPKPVALRTYLINKDGSRILLGNDEFFVLQGGTPIIFSFPICSLVNSGSYTLRFEVISKEGTDGQEATFVVN